MKIALIQQHATSSKSENLTRGLRSAVQAIETGAQIIAFAELAFEPFYPRTPAQEGFRELAESIPGPITDAFSELAKKQQVVFVLNLFERDGEQTFDSSPVIDADGTVLGVTRMIHITDYPQFHEQGYYQPGMSSLSAYNTRYAKLGVAICYDRHFPEYMRGLGVAGAEVVFIPQAGTIGEWPPGLYEAELRVAAFQNGYFTALCNRVGREGEMEFSGESFVSDPDGNVIARAALQQDQILYADLDLSLIQNSHARRLFWRHRRPELYSRWLNPAG